MGFFLWKWQWTQVHGEMLPLHPNNESECQGCWFSCWLRNHYNSLINLPTTISLLEPQRVQFYMCWGDDLVVIVNQTCRLGCVTWSCLVLLVKIQFLLFAISSVCWLCPSQMDESYGLWGSSKWSLKLWQQRHSDVTEAILLPGFAKPTNCNKDSLSAKEIMNI